MTCTSPALGYAKLETGVKMTTRTNKVTVTFNYPFVLDGVDGVLPPGDYLVETNEELLDGVSFHAYRPTATLIHVAARPGYPGTQTLTINADDLDAALHCDRAPGRKALGQQADLKNANGGSKPLGQRAETSGVLRALGGSGQELT